MSDSSMGSNQHLSDSIIRQLEQIKPFALQTRPFNSFALTVNSSLKVTHNIKLQLNLELFLFVPKGSKGFFVFVFMASVRFVFLFWPEHSRYIDMPGHISENPKCSAVLLGFFCCCCCCTTLSLSSSDLSVQGSSASLGPQSRHGPLGNPRGKANCIFYKSLLLLLPFLPSLLPCFLPSCFCEEIK